MAWKSEHRFRDLEDPVNRRIIGIEPQFTNPFAIRDTVDPPFDVGGEPIHEIPGESHHRGDLPHRASPPEGDHFRDEGRSIPSVLFVDVLENLLPAFVLEIDVDVRGLVSFAADESLEEHVDPSGIHGGDAQAVAHRGVRRCAASLAEDRP